MSTCQNIHWTDRPVILIMDDMTATDVLTPAATTRAGLDFDAVLRTYEAISRVLPETPSWSYPLLNAEIGRAHV